MQYKRAEILEKIVETPSTVSLILDSSIQAHPGQYIMLTDFVQAEKPFSISDRDEKTFTLTIRNLGRFSKQLTELQTGDVLFYRGPYGKPFSLPNQPTRILVIGGGCGSAPLRYLINCLLRGAEHSLTFINGARTKNELLFQNIFLHDGFREILVTDDGSFGERGNSAEAFENIIRHNKFDLLYVSGPELMMKRIHDTAKTVQLEGEFLLERYMKCGIGICGSCVLDPIGIRLCCEGPVVHSTLLEQVSEFGQYHRDASGTKIQWTK